MEIINIYKKSGINTSSKMLQLLVNSWCRNIKYSTIDLAMILDEIGVEKFLPGSSELLSGTLSCCTSHSQNVPLDAHAPPRQFYLKH